MQIPAIEDELGVRAPDFSLPGTDGNTYSLSDVAGKNGTVVVFICNHCPYVQAVAARLVEDARKLAAEGVGFVAISCNDVAAFPEDSFDNMKAFAKERDLPFPYLFDEGQDVARAYGALCTPDFFGINADGSIEYRGRLDEGKKEPPPPGAKRELVDAMRLVAKTGKGPADQIPSVGCSIKWKDD
jgi:peroxiredoxin